MSSFLIKVEESSAMIEMNIPLLTNYRNMSAKISKNGTNVDVLLIKNEQRVEINGFFNNSPKSTDLSFKCVCSDAGIASAVAAFQYNVTSTTTNVVAKVSFDDQVFEANGSVGTGRDLIAKAQILTPFTNYQQMFASLSFKRSTNSFRATLSKNHDMFEIYGSFTNVTTTTDVLSGGLYILDSN